MYVQETGVSTNAFTVSCSAGSNCGTFAFVSGNFSIPSGGDNIYAYTDTDADPTNGISSIHSLLYTVLGAVPTTANPSSVYPNAVVVSGFSSVSPNRTEYKFTSSERAATINLTNIQNTTNYLIAQTTAALSVVPFTALDLCAATISVQPIDKTVCANDNTTFSVTSTGTMYQWQVNTGSGGVEGHGHQPVPSRMAGWAHFLKHLARHREDIQQPRQQRRAGWRRRF